MTNYLAADLGETFFGGSHFLQDMEGVGELVSIGVSNAIIIAGVILIILIIYSGQSMITAAGNAQQFEKSRLILTTSVVGFVIITAAWFIVRWVESSTGTVIL